MIYNSGNVAPVPNVDLLTFLYGMAQSEQLPPL